MANNEPQNKDYDPESYWSIRYQTIDITKSGHIDLPAAYNVWLYRCKKDGLLKALDKAGFQLGGSSVMEVATGTGVYVELWKQQGVKRMSGIDISEAATDHMKQRFPDYHFSKRDVSEPGLESVVGNGFDLVTAIDVLYHVIEDEKFANALENLAQISKPGGLLVVHERFLQHRERSFKYIRWRTLETYVAALDRAGFDVLFRMPTFFFSVRPYDFKSPLTEQRMNQLWNKLLLPFILRYPDATGRLIYWLDKSLGRIFNTGPAFDMMVCRRR